MQNKGTKDNLVVSVPGSPLGEFGLERQIISCPISFVEALARSSSRKRV